jgi:hypothetical protein
VVPQTLKQILEGRTSMRFALGPIHRLAIWVEQIASPDIQHTAPQVTPVDFVQGGWSALRQLRLYEGERRLDLGHFEDRGTGGVSGRRPGSKATGELPLVAVDR